MIESLIVSLLLCSPAKAQESMDFSDQAIEQKRRDLDSFYEILSRQVEKDFSEELDFETGLENDRLAFEKRLVQERKDFLETLKRVSPEQRPQAFADFWQRQKASRQDFIKKQDERRSAFDRPDQRDLRRRQRDVVEDYDNG